MANVNDSSVSSSLDSSTRDVDAGNQMAETHSSAQEDIFSRLQVYPFHTDLEFKNGLSIILGRPGTPATDAEIDRKDDLVLQAKCFYFSRKENINPPLSFSAYKIWLESESARKSPSSTEATVVPEKSQKPHASGSAAESSSSDPNIHENNAPRQAEEPTYPSSFAHIVELITTGQPIPGIQQIPDTVLAGHDTSSAKPRRQKPWEADGNAPDERKSETRNIEPV